MAATNPSGDPDRYDRSDDRPTLASAPAPTTGRRWIGVVVAVVVLAIVAIVAYMLLYGGGSGGGTGGGGGGGAGYTMIAFSGEAIRRLARKFER
jgi:hypothetical protein